MNNISDFEAHRRDEQFDAAEDRRMAAKQIIADLTYANYRHNRTISPEVTPERWVKVYGPKTMEMEKRYQEEQGRNQKGQALLEFAFVLPLFFILLLAGGNMLWLISAKQDVDYVATETARCMTISTSCDMRNYAISVGTQLKMSNIQDVSVFADASCGNTCELVTVTYPVKPIFAGFFPTVTLTSVATRMIGN